MLFQRFDRLLFLAKGGKTVYYGDIGENSSILTNYFEKNGASPCPPEANPAEWMLELIGAAPGSHTDIDWPNVWRKGPEKSVVDDELARKGAGTKWCYSPTTVSSREREDESSYREFAAPLGI
jgi:ATP-binding cassette subfamily G (WHITE) protein 2 (PDR)